MKKLVIYATTFLPASALAQLDGGVDASRPRDADKKSTVPDDLIAWIGLFTNVLLFLAGAIAVIVIIYGGIRYATSTGDAARVKQAKDTILYGVIGLVVSILAFAIVQFIIQNLG